MKNIDLTPIFQALITLIAALVSCRLIPWLKSKTTEQQQQNLVSAARIAVYAAQQLYGANKANNEKKLDYALTQLRYLGFDLDTQTLRAAIEKAVYELKPATKIEDIANFLIAQENKEEEEEDLAELAEKVKARNDDHPPDVE